MDAGGGVSLTEAEKTQPKAANKRKDSRKRSGRKQVRPAGDRHRKGYLTMGPSVTRADGPSH